MKKKTPDILVVSKFMDGFLGKESLMDLPYPEALQGDFHELTAAGKAAWVEFTHFWILREAGNELKGILKREILNQTEVGLVSRRIKNFLDQCGFTYTRF